MENELGCERAPQVMQVLGRLRSSLRIDVNDASGVADAIEAATKTVGVLTATKTGHQHRVDPLAPRSPTKFLEQRIKFGNARHGGEAPLAPVNFEGLLDDGELADVIPGESDQVSPAQAGQCCKSKTVKDVRLLEFDRLGREAGDIRISTAAMAPQSLERAKRPMEAVIIGRGRRIGYAFTGRSTGMELK